MVMDALCRLLGRKAVLVESGDHAILEALKVAKTRVLLQDQGGWLTYRDYPKRCGLEIVFLKTVDGYLSAEELQKHVQKDDVLLLNSMPGYVALQDNVDELFSVTKNAGALLINDCSGSIGTGVAKVGDVLLCSFGKDKPVNVGYGGCITVDTKETFDFSKKGDLTKKLGQLSGRLEFLTKMNREIKKDLENFNIVHKDKTGINVIIKGNKEEVINYCKKNKYPFTLCPRYIRISVEGVSVEVKRLEFI
jgi:hypothetical protein